MAASVLAWLSRSGGRAYVQGFSFGRDQCVTTLGTRRARARAEKAAHLASLTDEEIIEIAAPSTNDIQAFSGTPAGAAQLEMMRG